MTPHKVNCEMVPSVQPYTCLADEAHGPKVFHIAQDHMVKTENRSKMYHLCQYRGLLSVVTVMVTA